MTQQLAPLLTERMQPVVDAIGWDAAISLVSAFGGTRVLISDDPRSVLVRCIGSDAARDMKSALGPGALDVPRCLSWLLARRNEEICARWLAGETQAELALRFQLTERHVRTILRTDAPQQAATTTPDLFTPQHEDRSSSSPP